MLLAVDLHLGARVLAEEDAVADLHVELAQGAVFENLAAAHGDDLTLDRLLFGRVGDDDSTLGLLFFLHALEKDSVLKGTNGHVATPELSKLSGFVCFPDANTASERIGRVLADAEVGGAGPSREASVDC